VVVADLPRRRFYQLAFLTPGSLPFDASSLKQIRQQPNLRMYARGRPHNLQRLRARTEYLAGRFARTICEVFAIGI
jgi:hypothetical protein